jgi:Family of unknown function (DUF5906)
MSGQQNMTNKIEDEHPKLGEVKAHKQKTDETLKLAYPPSDEDIHFTLEEAKASHAETMAALRGDADEHPTLNEAKEIHKRTLEETSGNVGYHPEKTREQKNEAARKARKVKRARNEQQLLLEMQQSKGLDGLRHTLNKYFAFSVIGGKAKYIREIGDDFTIWEPSTMAEWCSNKPATIETIDPEMKVSTKEVPLLPIYKAGRLEYPKGLSFNPGSTFDRNDRSIDAYETWRGWETLGKKWTSVAEKRSLKEVLRFIYVIICDKNAIHFHWVCSWIADLIQHPDAPKGVALVLIGSKGIGKTFFGELICALIGEKYSFITADKNDIFGDFNGHLERLMFLVLEEAVWAQNHQIEAILKVIITGKRRSSHAKYQDDKMVPNFLRSLILANPGWAVPMSQDERRFTVLNPSSSNKEDHAYFGQLYSHINAGRSAIMYYFENYRIGKSGVNIRSGLKTKEGENQKDESLEPFERWLLEEFTFTGSVMCCKLLDDGKEGMEIVRSDLRDMYSAWCKENGIRQRKVMTTRQFGIKLGAYFPRLDDRGNVMRSDNGRVKSIFSGESTHTSDGKTYPFPSITETRHLIGKILGKDESYWEDGSDKWAAHPSCGKGSPSSVAVSSDDKAKIKDIIDGVTTIVTVVTPPHRKF